MKAEGDIIAPEDLDGSEHGDRTGTVRKANSRPQL